MARGRRSAFVTGVVTGIGKAVASSLAAQGYALTLVDIDGPGVRETAAHIERTHGVPVAARVVDVRDAESQREAFAAHVAQYQSLDVVVLNAGIGERGDLFAADNQGWQLTLDVDLTAVILGIRLAVLALQSSGLSGTIVSIASAGGLFPMPVAPVYAASKAGVVHFTRSAAPGLARKSIRIMAACPEFVDTPLVRKLMVEDPGQARRLLGSLDIQLLPPKAVADLVLDLTQPQAKAGSVVLLRQDGSRVAYPFKAPLAPASKSSPTPTSLLPRGPQPIPPSQGQGSGAAAGWRAWVAAPYPTTYAKLQVHKLSPDFSAATRLLHAPLAPLLTPPPGQLLLRRVFVGINASDINYSAGRYHASKQEAQAHLPFDCGFESVSVVAAVGQGVTGLQPGDPVATMSYDGFSEWALAPASQALRLPRPSAEMVALLTSGLTASIALQEAGHMRSGETVLVTAAAGGTGQFAVQLAKLAGCHVIATAGGQDKVALCKRLGADRVVDYRSERLKEVLKAEYPRGVDVVYEGVGGDMFNDALGALAQRGRLIIIGMMSQYQEGWPLSSHPGLPEKLLWKSASLVGFFLLRYASHFKSHLARLVQLMDEGKLQVALDPVPFKGVAAVPQAVAHLHSGRSVGKVVVQLADLLPPGVQPVQAETLSKL